MTPFEAPRTTGVPMTVTLAPAALDRVRGYLAQAPDAVGLRFGVKKTGCSGWGYLADLAREQRPEDTVFEQDGVRILVDAESLALVDGTEIDFLKQGLNEQFVFRNPNVTAECGCGESFTTRADAA
jgi:iron-sulfur cluster assembly protein